MLPGPQSWYSHCRSISIAAVCKAVFLRGTGRDVASMHRANPGRSAQYRLQHGAAEPGGRTLRSTAPQRLHRAPFPLPTHRSLGCWRYVWSGLFRETQVLGQRPRTGSPYHYSIITHQHYQVLSHFGPKLCPVQLSHTVLLCGEEAYTEVAEWQLFCKSSQWRPAFFCFLSELSHVDSHKQKKLQPRSCMWRPWWVCGAVSQQL